MSFIKNLFKEVGVKDVITLFHNPRNHASLRVHSIVKQAAASPVAHATTDQASEHSKPADNEQPEFSLDVQDQPPTSDQLTNILDYLGPGRAADVIKDASGSNDALRRFKQDAQSFQAPILVDWSNGKAVAGDNESEILKLIRERPQKS